MFQAYSTYSPHILPHICLTRVLVMVMVMAVQIFATGQQTKTFNASFTRPFLGKNLNLTPPPVPLKSLIRAQQAHELGR